MCALKRSLKKRSLKPMVKLTNIEDQVLNHKVATKDLNEIQKYCKRNISKC